MLRQTVLGVVVMGINREIRKPMGFLVKAASYLLLLTFLLQVLTVTPVFAEEATSAPEASTVTVEIPASEKQFFELFQDIKNIIMQFYPGDVDSGKLNEGAIRGLFESLNDPYSQYFDKEQFQSLSQSLEGEFSGIGVTIELINGNITVVSVFKDSPAERAGIKAGDIIVEVDGHDLRGKVPRDASELLRGKEGTTVVVTVNRPSQKENLVFSMTRAVITVYTLDMKDLGEGLFYVDVDQFTSTTGKNLSAIMVGLRSVGAKGVVLDLRNNPGGLLDAAIEVSGEFVPKGPVVELRYKGTVEVLESDKDTIPIPTVVLVDNGTASASEIVAGAIRDRGKGILVGQQTFGKGCIQALAPLGEDLGGFRLTIAEYYTPSGAAIAGVGLKPDIEVKQEPVDLPERVLYKRPLKKGVVGLDVLALQECLEYLGYEPGEADGVFGSKTESACILFLNDRGQKYAGSIGEKEVSLLNGAILDTAVDVPDAVLETGISALKKWIGTGTWR